MTLHICALLLKQMDESTDAVLTVDVSSCEIASGSADGSARTYSIRDGKMTDGEFAHWKFLGEKLSSVHLELCISVATIGCTQWSCLC